MKLASLLFVGLVFLNTAVYAQLELEDLIFTSEVLPEGCMIKSVGENDRLPCELRANPFVSSERTFLNCFARNFVRDSVVLQKVTKGLFSVYEEEDEIGIYALETDSEETTEHILKNITNSGNFDDGGEFFTSGRILIWLWHDRRKPKAYDELKKLIQLRLK